MGLDQRFIIRINKDERELEMRKLYPVHNVLIPIKGMVSGQLHLDDVMVRDLLGKLEAWCIKTRMQTNVLAAKYPNGVRMFDIPQEDMQAFRDYDDMEYVLEVIAFFKAVIPKDGDDVLVVYVFDC